MTEINPSLTGKRAEGARLWAASDWADVASFTGPNAARFERVWARLRDQSMAKGAGFAQSWCWPALLFGFAWFFYRKLWGMGVALLILPPVIGCLLGSQGGAIGVSAASTILAKNLYVQHAVTRIARIRAAGGGADEIAAAGGTSLAGGAIGGVLFALALGAVIWSAASGVPVSD